MNIIVIYSYKQNKFGKLYDVVHIEVLQRDNFNAL